MKNGGTYVSIAWALPAPDKAAEANITATGLLVHPDAHTLTKLAEWVDKGAVTPTLERVFPLAHAKQAHELGETDHTLGKIVLDCLA
jgi:NADPH:quinone reductase-like Zn-dependent oxidoreductase